MLKNIAQKMGIGVSTLRAKSEGKFEALAHQVPDRLL
jgi:hypothetical protein